VFEPVAEDAEKNSFFLHWLRKVLTF